MSEQPKTSTVNRVRTPADDVVDAWWGEWVEDSRGLGIDVGARRTVLHQLAQQPEGVQRGVMRKARGQ